MLSLISPKGVDRPQLQGGLVAGLLALQRLLDLFQRVAVAAVQIGHRLLDLFDELAQGVRDFVAQGDDGVFFDFHGRVRWAGLWFVGAIFAQPSATPWRRHRIAQPSPDAPHPTERALHVQRTTNGPSTGSRWRGCCPLRR